MFLALIGLLPLASCSHHAEDVEKAVAEFSSAIEKSAAATSELHLGRRLKLGIRHGGDTHALDSHGSLYCLGLRSKQAKDNEACRDE